MTQLAQRKAGLLLDGSHLVEDLREILACNRSNDLLHEGILVLSKVVSLDLGEELGTTGLGNKECLSGPAALEGDLSSVLELANQQVLLDDGLGTLIPVNVAGHCLLHNVLSTAASRSVKLLLLARCLVHDLLVTSGNLRL